MKFALQNSAQNIKQRRTQRMLWSAANLLTAANSEGRVITRQELALRAQCELLGASVISKAVADPQRIIYTNIGSPSPQGRGTPVGTPLSNQNEVEVALAAIRPCKPSAN